MKTNVPHNTRAITLIMILTLIVLFILFNELFLKTGLAVEEAEAVLQLEKVTTTISVDSSSQLVIVTTTTQDYTRREEFTIFGQILNSVVSEPGKPDYRVTYDYDGNPNTGPKELKKITDNHGIAQEYIRYDDTLHSELPTLAEYRFPAAGPQLYSGSSQPTSNLYMFIKYTDINQPPYFTISEGWLGPSPQEAQNAASYESPAYRTLIGDKNQLIFVPPDYTRSIEVTWQKIGEKRRLYEVRSLTYDELAVQIYKYNQNNLPTQVTFITDKGNDGNYEQHIERELFYNPNNLLITYTDTDLIDGSTDTYTVLWDRDDQYATLDGITGPYGPLLVIPAYAPWGIPGFSYFNPQEGLFSP